MLVVPPPELGLEEEVLLARLPRVDGVPLVHGRQLVETKPAFEMLSPLATDNSFG